MFRRLVVPSFAKVNWILKVLGKRADGYHEVRTVYQTIDLCDQLVFEVSWGTHLEIEVQGLEVAGGEQNLVFRAAELLRKTAAGIRGAKIQLNKRIPIGAGLGGGSGNAATALLALNQLWQCGLNLLQMAGLGAQLGSDIPFFLLGGTVLGRGRGEQVLPLRDVPDQTLLVLYPPLEMPTKLAYSLANWGDWCASEVLTSPESDTRIERFRKAVEKRERVWAYLENDFEAPLFKHYPLIAEAAQSLTEAGCSKVTVCGSGSALLGVINSSRLEKAAEAVSQRKLGQVFCCHTLSRKQYRKILMDSGLHLPNEAAICLT